MPASSQVGRTGPVFAAHSMPAIDLPPDDMPPLFLLLHEVGCEADVHTCQVSLQAKKVFVLCEGSI
jgi:hypothetical protein